MISIDRFSSPIRFYRVPVWYWYDTDWYRNDIAMLWTWHHSTSWYRGKGYKLIWYPKIWYNQVIYFLSSSGGFFPPKCHRSINSSPPEHTVSFIWGVQSGCLWNASARPYTYCGTALRNLKFNGMQIQVCTCLYQSYWTKKCEKAIESQILRTLTTACRCCWQTCGWQETAFVLRLSTNPAKPLL